MCALLETLTIAASLFATSFRVPRPGPIAKITDEELIALAVAQAMCGTVPDRRFLGTVESTAARPSPGTRSSRSRCRCAATARMTASTARSAK
jgi:hypothetical protein